ILVVDDDESTRNLLNSVLTAEGYSCQTAPDVETAATMMRERPFQMAFIDLYLGTANGLNVLDFVKVLQPQCSFVMMTAHASMETVAASLGSGAIEYLGKPLLIEELLAIVRRVRSKSVNGKAKITESDGPSAGTSIVGRSPKMLEVYRAIA